MRVLSIDLDYIMAPTDHISREIAFSNNPMVRWDAFYNSSKYKKEDLYYDENKLIFLQNLFSEAIKYCDNVKFGYDHDSILYHIADYDSIELINIDEHDDVLMCDYDFVTSERRSLEQEVDYMLHYDAVNEGNWIGWLNVKKKLKSLVWIANKYSLIGRKKQFVQEFIDDYTYVDDGSYQIDNYKFDHIFVCLSPQYIPTQHWNVINWFIETYEQHSGTKVDPSDWDNKKFEIEYLHRKVTDAILHKRANDWKPVSGSWSRRRTEI